MNTIKKILQRETLRFVLVNLGICIAAYLVLISNQLTNTFDGLWNGSYYDNYSLVTSVGRWFWPILGKARLNVSPEPFTSIISLGLFVVGSSLVVYWFQVKGLIRKHTIVLCATISVAVCACLSYRFMSPTYAVSYFFSIAAIWILRKPDWKRTIVSAVLMTLSLGCYQADLGCSCVLILIWSIHLLVKDEGKKGILRFLMCAMIALLGACLFYKLIWKLALLHYGIAANNYLGANNLSIATILKSFPESFINTYKGFYEFFFAGYTKQNVYQGSWIYCLILVLFAVLIVFAICRNLRRNKIRIFLVLVLLALLPASANVSMILAAYTGIPGVPMTVPMSTILPFLLCVDTGKTTGDTTNRLAGKYDPRMITGHICLALLILIFLGDFLMISIDQHVLKNSTDASVSMMNRIFQDIDWNGDLDREVVFVGRPADNVTFRKDELWELANPYARYGKFAMESPIHSYSYFGLVRDSGLDITINWWQPQIWDELYMLEAVQEMPAYPTPGYIKEIEGRIVVKVSE